MNSISFIGGDERNYLVSKMMEKKYSVLRFGLWGSDSELKECIDSSDVLVFPIPLSKDGIHMYTPEQDNMIEISNIISIIKNKTIFTGRISKEHMLLLKKCGNNVIDVMNDTDFISKNAVATAEGIIANIIENTKTTIAGSKTVVLGFGNTGKAVSKRIQALGANVFAFDINQQEVANIRLSGYNVLEEIDKYIGDMDVIINTVPEMMIDEKRLKLIRKDSFIIDIASFPGGVNFEYAKAHGYNVVHELGIPGKIAPISAAEYVKDVIEKYI